MRFVDFFPLMLSLFLLSHVLLSTNTTLSEVIELYCDTTSCYVISMRTKSGVTLLKSHYSDIFVPKTAGQ